MATTTTRLGLKVIDTPAVDLVSELRLSINNHATILDAQYLESTYALRPAAASKGRVHRSTDTGEIAIDTGAAWEPLWGPASISRSVLDTGLVGQSRAGRQLAATDFTDCGAAAPVALWNLSDLTDASGNGFSLTNKGSVAFAPGVEGAASTAALFTGSTAQALYRVDAADALRIRTGSVGGWHKSAKRATYQAIVSKFRITGNQRAYWLGSDIGSGSVARFQCSVDGSVSALALGTTDICDDRWHFVVGTYDGSTVRVYVDGVLEGSAAQWPTAGPLCLASAPTNIGGYDADSGTASANPHFGRADEVFVTGEVLTEDQIRHLYGCKFAHGGNAPRRASLRVTRRRKGAALANGDFPSNPNRCYNFVGGALTELNGGAALTVTPTSVTTVAGPDGQKDSAVFVASGNHLQVSDASMPSLLASRTYSLWFNALTAAASQVLLGWGTNTTADAKIQVNATTGYIDARSGADTIVGPFVADGKWHHAAVVENDTAADGLKRKLYLDGLLVGASTVLTSLTPIGDNGFRIGASPAGSSPLTGAVSRVQVHAAALTWEQVQAVYMKSSALLQASPKDAADHVEMLGSTNAVFVGDELEPQDLIDLEVSR